MNPSPALPLKRGGKVIKNSPLFEKEGLGEIFKNNKNLTKNFK